MSWFPPTCKTPDTFIVTLAAPTASLRTRTCDSASSSVTLMLSLPSESKNATGTKFAPFWLPRSTYLPAKVPDSSTVFAPTRLAMLAMGPSPDAGTTTGTMLMLMAFLLDVYVDRQSD